MYAIETDNCDYCSITFSCIFVGCWLHVVYKSNCYANGRSVQSGYGNAYGDRFTLSSGYGITYRDWLTLNIVP